MAMKRPWCQAFAAMLLACGGDVVVDGPGAGGASATAGSSSAAAAGGVDGLGGGGGETFYCQGQPCIGECVPNLGCMCGGIYGGCEAPAICCFLTGACSSQQGCPEQ